MPELMTEKERLEREAATPQTLWDHFRALQARVTKEGERWRTAVAAFGVTVTAVAGLLAWQAVINGEVSDLQNRVGALEEKLAAVEPKGDEALVGTFSTADPTPRWTCAAWDEAAGEGYRRCAYLGNNSVTAQKIGAGSTQPSLFVEGPEDLRVVVWAKKIGG